MPRRKPASAKHKRLKLQDKRALKRGDITAEEHAQSLLEQNKQYGRVRLLPSKSGGPAVDGRKLHSRFVALSPTYLTRMRDLAFSRLLPRPLPAQSAVFPLEILTERDPEEKLTCPSRPKFRYGQTKKEVEKNEEGYFKKWLGATEKIMQDWVDAENTEKNEDGTEDEEEHDGVEKQFEWPRGPTWFETNLEVWRQLWRVTESSSILLLLLDSRCPPLHCPPSLRSYLRTLSPKKEVILVLTKSDLVDPAALRGWQDWVQGWWGENVQVVSVRSYDVDLLNDGKGKHRPDIPQHSLDELITALRTAHERLLAPPAWATANPDKLKQWRPSVRPAVDWTSLAQGDAGAGPSTRHSSRQGKSSAHHSEPEDEHDGPAPSDVEDAPAEGEGEGRPAPRDPSKEPLTIGLIGQPNVGKSSLLNALLGEQRVRASRTPGKTKHFQTMYWGDKKEIKVVDCPGLVCPSLVGLEIQALAATIPISQIASMPSCITFASHHLPLETIFRVPYSVADTDFDPYAGKRTYRDPALAEAERIRREEEAKKEKWTAGKIMEGRAVDRGYLTAKSGRPDTNRAANGIMRNLADGRVRWGFFPPPRSTDGTTTETDPRQESELLRGREGRGIWLESAADALLDQEGEAEGSEREKEITIESEDTLDSEDLDELEIEDYDLDDVGAVDDDVEDGDEIEEEEDEEDEVPQVKSARGFFAALEVDDEDVDDDADADEDEGNEGDSEGAKER